MNPYLTKEIAVTRTSLAELLQLNKKDAMLAIAENQAAEVRKSHTKAKIAADLAKHIEETFLEQANYFRSETMEDIERVTAQNESTSIYLSLEQVATISELASQGYLYIHKKEETPIAISVALELTEQINELKQDQLKQQILKTNQKLVDYTVALAHVYGVYSIEQLIKVWQTYQTDQLPIESLTETLPQIVANQTGIQWNKTVIYDSSFSDEQEAVSFYDQLGSRKIPYIMPTEDELGFYADHTINKQSPHYLNIHHFIQLKGYDQATEDNIMAEIDRVVFFDTRLEKVYESLAEMGLLFSKEEDVISFVQLFQELSNGIRKWSYGGWKVNEFNALQEEPPKKIPVKVNKVGRNEPCPCGSGKKYKKCHGQ
jgi:hypothetical protein